MDNVAIESIARDALAYVVKLSMEIQSLERRLTYRLENITRQLYR